MLALAPTVDIVLGLTLAVGLAGVFVVSAIQCLGGFKQDAGARFYLWFALLLVLAVAAPSFTAATIAAFRAEPIVVSAGTLPAVTEPVRIDTTARTFAAPAAYEREASVYRPPDPAKPALPLAADALVLVWIAGAFGFLVRVGIGVIRIRRLTPGCRLVEMRSTPQRNVRILEHPRLSVPIAIGYRRPAVLIPSALLESAPPDDVENVVLHELEHLQRFDDVTSFVQSICLSLLWFNPLAHYVVRRIAVEREMACDEAVVRRIGKRHGYASTLWNVALSVSDSLVPSFSSAFASGSQTVSRVANLLDTAHTRVSRRVVALAIVAVMAAFAGVSLVAAAAIGSVRPVITDAASVALLDGTTLVVGGRNTDGTPVDEAEIYRANARVALVPMAIPRWSTTLTRLRNGDVLVTGGMTPDGTTADVELFNARTRTFELVNRLHVARVAHTATLLADGTVLVAAGERAPGKLESSTEIYDPLSRTFRLTADGYGRISQSAIRIDGSDVLMMGGDPGRGRKNCAIIYSATRHIYHNAGTLVRATADHLTFLLPNGTYVTHTID